MAPLILLPLLTACGAPENEALRAENHRLTSEVESLSQALDAVRLAAGEGRASEVAAVEASAPRPVTLATDPRPLTHRQSFFATP